MKKIIYNIISAACLAVPLASCSDFLEIKPQNEIVLEDFWTEKADVDNMVTGCYAALESDAAVRRMMMWGEFRSDNVMAGIDTQKDINLYNVFRENITPKNWYTNWSVFYQVINRCNTIIKYAPEVAQRDPAYSNSEVQATIAEVSALRDLCYFYLIRTFRDVPYTTEAFTDDDQEMQLEATPFYTVLSYLIADLESVKSKAIKRYPETQKVYQTGRITQDAINAMLCEMYLWNKDYANCIRCADEVIKSKKDQAEEERLKNGKSIPASEQRLEGYPLVNNFVSGTNFGGAFNEIFTKGNSRETIFELVFDNNEAGNTMPSNAAAGEWYGNAVNPGRVAAGSAITEDAEADENKRTIFQGVNKKLDARIYFNLLGGSSTIAKMVYRSVLVDASSSTPTVAYSNAYNYAKINDVEHWYNSSNWIIYRLSDIMLLKAEALCQLMREGNDAETEAYNANIARQAFTLANVVNKRSYCVVDIKSTKDTLDFNNYQTKSALENLVMRERQVELMFEGKRWYDLVRRSMRDGRTDVLCEAVSKRNGPNPTLASNFFGNPNSWQWAIFWPYNYEELIVNKKLKANPAYGDGNTSNIE
ncbi:MAG: RagB/SusD family nutrient uptake outer membrane protein [Prevotella sp.]|nr:RagB/SusD family nutrient uptake outer membrane protein [Prevotella sp.]